MFTMSVTTWMCVYVCVNVKMVSWDEIEDAEGHKQVDPFCVHLYNNSQSVSQPVSTHLSGGVGYPDVKGLLEGVPGVDSILARLLHVQPLSVHMQKTRG